MMHGALIRAFVRTTEDPAKVLEAVKNVYPELRKDEIDLQEHRGIYGNVFYSITIKLGKRKALSLWKHLWKKLDPEDKEFLRDHIEEFVDEWGQLHIRIRKQDAYQGKLRLGTSGVIKIVFRLEAYPAKPEKFREVARRLVSLP